MLGELEHLKIKTRLMGEAPMQFFFKKKKKELKFFFLDPCEVIGRERAGGEGRSVFGKKVAVLLPLSDVSAT